MKIITGRYKGYKINTTLPGQRKIDFRPSTSKVRGAVFNVLTHMKDFDFAHSKVLDLYCGSGSFGLEALSREAGFVTFVDSNSIQCKLVEYNLNKLNINQKEFDVLNRDASKQLKLQQHSYDLVYIDPPYNDISLVFNTLDNLIHHVHKDTIIVIEKSRKVVNQPYGFFTDKILEQNTYYIFETKKYGITEIYFMRMKNDHQ